MDHIFEQAGTGLSFRSPERLWLGQGWNWSSAIGYHSTLPTSSRAAKMSGRITGLFVVIFFNFAHTLYMGRAPLQAQAILYFLPPSSPNPLHTASAQETKFFFRCDRNFSRRRWSTVSTSARLVNGQGDVSLSRVVACPPCFKIVSVASPWVQDRARSREFRKTFGGVGKWTRALLRNPSRNTCGNDGRHGRWREGSRSGSEPVCSARLLFSVDWRKASGPEPRAPRDMLP